MADPTLHCQHPTRSQKDDFLVCEGCWRHCLAQQCCLEDEHLALRESVAKVNEIETYASILRETLIWSVFSLYVRYPLIVILIGTSTLIWVDR